VVAGAGHHLAIRIGVAVVLGIALGAVGGSALARRLRAGARRLAALILVFALGLFALALAVVRLRLVQFAEFEVEILNQPARGTGIGVLVRDRAVQLGDIPGDLSLKPGPPPIDD